MLVVCCVMSTIVLLVPIFFRNASKKNNHRYRGNATDATEVWRALTMPPHSLDRTCCNIFLRGYAKSKVHATKPRDLAQLEERICMVCSEIEEKMLIKGREPVSDGG